jgi:hypothetical protein
VSVPRQVSPVEHESVATTGKLTENNLLSASDVVSGVSDGMFVHENSGSNCWCFR